MRPPSLSVEAFRWIYSHRCIAVAAGMPLQPLRKGAVQDGEAKVPEHKLMLLYTAILT